MSSFLLGLRSFQPCHQRTRRCSVAGGQLQLSEEHGMCWTVHRDGSKHPPPKSCKLRPLLPPRSGVCPLSSICQATLWLVLAYPLEDQEASTLCLSEASLHMWRCSGWEVNGKRPHGEKMASWRTTKVPSPNHPVQKETTSPSPTHTKESWANKWSWLISHYILGWCVM